MFFSDAEFLNETVLEHLARVAGLQVDEQEAVRPLRNVLQQLLDLVGGVVARDLLDDGFALESVAERRPDEERGEINSDDVREGPELLGRDPNVAPKMPRSDGQRGYQVRIVVHDPFVVHEVVEDPKHLWDLLHLLFFRFLCHLHVFSLPLPPASGGPSAPGGL